MDLSGLSNVTTTLGATSLVLVSPSKTVGYQPTSSPTLDNFMGPLPGPPPALLFHYEAENQVDLESDITDHYIEDNTTVGDQIALKPEIITVRGFVGELNDVPPYGLQTAKALADKLGALGAYAPVVSTTALIAYNTAFALYQAGQNAINSAMSAWNTNFGFGSGGGANVIGADGLQGGAFNPATGKIGNWQNNQQTAFQQFYGYWRQRTLFTVQTPWAIFQNCAIKSIKAVQDPESAQITDFLVTFKMLRVTQSAFDDTQVQGRLNAQAADNTDLGTSAPTDSGGLGSSMSSMGIA